MIKEQFAMGRYILQVHDTGFSLIDKDKGLVVDGSNMWHDGQVRLQDYEALKTQMTNFGEWNKRNGKSVPDIEFTTVTFKRGYEV